MQFKTLILPSSIPLSNSNSRVLSKSSTLFNQLNRRHISAFQARIDVSRLPSKLLSFKSKRYRVPLRNNCGSPSHELVSDNREIAIESDGTVELISLIKEGAHEEEEILEVKPNELANKSIWNQVKEIMMFTGPATGLWMCGPLMSLIDTAVVGQGSSIELAALGPATVLCDYISYMFMFLSIATSNLVATSLARQDKNEVQHQISILLFLALACGFFMLLFTKFFGPWMLTAFTGPKNLDIVPAANTYVQIRGLAWPAVLVGWVAQSASLGMKDPWGPLKALAVASAINGIGDVVLCSLLGYGIAGAAWATMVSQVVAGYMMIEALNKKGYNGYAFSVPSSNELLTIFGLAAPVFLTMTAKVAFYTLIIYFATSMGTHTVAAHQVMLQTYSMSTVWGEPLSQTAQSFMPELLYGANRSLEKARMLLKSLVMIGATLGLALGIIGTSVPWLFPYIFTPDQKVIQEMHKVLIPYFLALVVTPSTHSLEGTLLAGRDLKFISLSMSGCFAFGALVLMFVSSRGYGLAGCWFALVGFQWARFSLSLTRLLSPDGILYSEDLSRDKNEKLRAV
ncbi:protein DETOXIFICATION 46, chloroplastic-like [Tripterygium wilfordii]|uniref:protein DETOXIFICATION 46, chloroplastic-like n=1 Tax=Tripterygium wilfordii TaxID=458696 RepID=UPI0018F812D6|nr:protein DETOXIFICATION 46, chloroplastic-like [Tripterygium wilfordii]